MTDTRIAISPEAEIHLRKIVEEKVTEPSERKVAFDMLKDHYIDAKDLSVRPGDLSKGFRHRLYVAVRYYAKTDGKNDRLDKNEHLEKIIDHVLDRCRGTGYYSRESLHCRFPGIKKSELVGEGQRNNAEVIIPGNEAFVIVHPQADFAAEEAIIARTMQLTESMAPQMPTVYLYSVYYTTAADGTGGYYLDPSMADYIVESDGGDNNLVMDSDVQTWHLAGGGADYCQMTAVMDIVNRFVSRPSAKEQTVLLHASGTYKQALKRVDDALTFYYETLLDQSRTQPEKIGDLQERYLKEMDALLEEKGESTYVTLDFGLEDGPRTYFIDHSNYCSSDPIPEITIRIEY